MVIIRGVPIIGLATISATDMLFFTNIGIGTEQQEDRYRYRYLYSSNSSQTDYALVFYFIHVVLAIDPLCSGLLFTLQQALCY